MRRPALIPAILCLLAAPAPAQDWPKPTEAGNKALDALIARCVEAGALARARDEKSGRDVLKLADPAKLAPALANPPIAEVAPVRDALVARTRSTPQTEQMAWITLLRALGEATTDPKARAFAALFEGTTLSRTDPGAAIDRFRQAAGLFEKDGQRAWQAGCLGQVGNTWYLLGDYRKARGCFEEALAIKLEALGPGHPSVGASYANVAACLQELGESARALEINQKALAIRLESLGPRHPDVAISYSNIATCQQELGESARALESHQKASAIWVEALGPRHPNVAISYANIATCLGELGEPARALEWHRKALAIKLESLGSGHPEVAWSYSDMANCHLELGEPARALEMHQKALAIRLEALGPRHPHLAKSYANLANCHRGSGDPARALEAYQKALAIWLEVLGPRHPDVARCYNSMASCHRALGDPARALEINQKALAIRRESLGPRHPDVAHSYEGIANCLQDLGDPARSLEMHREALAIRREALGPRHPLVAESYNNIAVCHQALGDSARALESYRESLAIRRESLGPRHPHLAVVHNNIAILRRDLGDSAEALEDFDLALASLRPAESAPIPASSFAAQILRQRASLVALGGDGLPADPSRALSDLGLAADMLDRLRDSGSGPDRSQEADLVHRGEGASELWPATIGLLAGLAERERDPSRLEAAFAAAERGASRAFLRSFGRAHASLAGRVSAEALAEAAACDSRLFVLDRKVEKAQSVPVEKRDPEAVGTLLEERREAEAARDKVVARIERDFPQYAALRYPRPCSLEQARATLGEDEVGLHFVAGPEASYLVVLERTPKAYPTGIGVHRLPDDDTLADRVAALVQDKVLIDPDAARERGSGLFDVLLGPAARAIEGRDLVVVAGGPLGELPFETLAEPDGEGGRRWLVQGHRVRYTPSLTALHFVGLWDSARTRADRPVWALGDPVYSADDPRMAKAPKPDEAASITLAQASRATRSEVPARLVASGAEVERIAGLNQAGASDRLVGAEATEAAVKRLSQSGELARYRLIHFACHGVLGSGEGLMPGLVLAQGGDQEGEDGYLRLDEVANLKLDADLVILSACQTARGKRGRVEGVGSLGRAFFYAGCRGVVGSLWKVDDAATADLMVAFHGRLKAGQPAGEALRATQLQAISDDLAPYYWAPFILFGR